MNTRSIPKLVTAVALTLYGSFSQADVLLGAFNFNSTQFGMYRLQLSGHALATQAAIC